MFVKNLNLNIVNKNILIIGHGKHGKSTVAQLISNILGTSHEDSSMMAAKIFIYDQLKQSHDYNSFEECYTDRHNHRALWHNLICSYNKYDKARLAKDIMAENDIYVGMRSDDELSECKRIGLFDMVIGVFDPNKPLEGKDSFNIDLFQQSDFIIITGDLEKTAKNVKEFCKILK